MRTLNFKPRTLNLRWAVNALALIAFALSSRNGTAQIQQAWVARYNNGIANGTNQAVKMALDNADNIYVTGFSENANSNLGYVTIKYAPNGSQLWVARYDSTNHSSASPSGLVLDFSNNVIVTGSALTIKYDTNGNQLWTAPYPGASLAVDTNGNVAVTGFGTSFNTVKLSPSGTNVWLQSFPASCGAAVGQFVVTDKSGGVYVIGSYPFFCERSIIDYEMLVIKYGANGSEIWTATHQVAGEPWQTVGATFCYTNNLYVIGNFTGGPAAGYVAFMYDVSGDLLWYVFPNNNAYSRVHALSVDQTQRALMTGQIATGFSSDYLPFFSCATMMLEMDGSTRWVSFYPANATATNVGNALAVDQGNNSYVTGYLSWNKFR